MTPKYIHKNPDDFAPYLHGKPGDPYDSAITFSGGTYDSWGAEGAEHLGTFPTIDVALAALRDRGYEVWDGAEAPPAIPADPLAPIRERVRAASEMFGLRPIGGHAEDVFRRAAELVAEGVSPAWLLGGSK